MEKIKVRKLVYYFWTLLFHLLCLSGLIWQVTQISVNLFQFDVSKDINIIMPEEVKDPDKIMYMCFDNNEVIDYQKYVKLLREKSKKDSLFEKFYSEKDLPGTKLDVMVELNIGERFDIAVNGNIFDYDYEDEVEGFLIGLKFCYQADRVDLIIQKNWFENLTDLYISMGQRLPLFDYRRLKIVKNIKAPLVIAIESFTYSTNKLKQPYTDKCFDYGTLNYNSRFDAITKCANMKTIADAGKTSGDIIIRKNESTNYGIFSYQNKYDEICAGMFEQFDCNQRVYFTQVPVPNEVAPPAHRVSLVVLKDSDPSFVIESKPRINNIDYVTYVLGALGSWLGFTFLILNPIPYIMKIGGSTIEPNEQNIDGDIGQNICECKQVSNLLKNRINHLEKEKNTIKANIELYKRKIDIVINQLIEDVKILNSNNK